MMGHSSECCYSIGEGGGGGEIDGVVVVGGVGGCSPHCCLTILIRWKTWKKILEQLANQQKIGIYKSLKLSNLSLFQLYDHLRHDMVD